MKCTLNCFRLENKAAIVTGINSGIGKAITEGFVGAGNKIVIVCRTALSLIEGNLEERRQQISYLLFMKTKNKVVY